MRKLPLGGGSRDWSIYRQGMPGITGNHGNHQMLEEGAPSGGIGPVTALQDSGLWNQERKPLLFKLLILP